MANRVSHKLQKPNYFKRLYLEGKEELSLIDIIIDGAAALIMTAIVLAFKFFSRDESLGLYLSAVIYSIVFFAIAFCLHVLIKAPYKIIKGQDKKIDELLEKFDPKFRLSCDKTMNGRITISGNGAVYFFRMKVETDCQSGVDGCLGHLYKIEFIQN